MKVEEGDIVHFHYTGKFENGEIFDTSQEDAAREAGLHNPQMSYQPLVVKIGAGHIIKGLDDALLGMEEGEEKEVTIPPEGGYGPRRPELLQQVPMGAFSQQGIDPKEGMLIGTSQGTAVVTGVGDDYVEVDFNHPLAGKTLVFEVKVKAIERG
ncbi:MAG: peptidylprolyl isomerase [Euryarchaeota archaeon]|nr:peptidylprolyl isomerase [Euryarchaeota archaeon]